MNYAAYARFYDRIGQSRLSLKLCPRFFCMACAALSREPRWVLDLCCGTGEAARWFANRGCRTVGVDLSAEMLRLAASKPGNVTWLRQDMRTLDAGTGFDLVTSMYDSVNYLLTEADQDAAFSGVYRALAPGGVFIFDYNSVYRYASHFAGGTITAVDQADLFGVYRTGWDPQARICTVRIRFFAAEEDGKWSGFEEVHQQRGWEHAEWESALRRAGFGSVMLGRIVPGTRVDDYRLGSVRPTTGRVIVLARK